MAAMVRNQIMPLRGPLRHGKWGDFEGVIGRGGNRKEAEQPKRFRLDMNLLVLHEIEGFRFRNAGQRVRVRNANFRLAGAVHFEVLRCAPI